MRRSICTFFAVLYGLLAVKTEFSIPDTFLIVAAALCALMAAA